MLRVLVVHPEAESATLRPFSEHPDALSTVPKGLCEARRVLEPAACAFARRLHLKQHGGPRNRIKPTSVGRPSLLP
jgi:hypothetical protein